MYSTTSSDKFWMNKYKFTRAGFEPATSGLTCRCAVLFHTTRWLWGRSKASRLVCLGSFSILVLYSFSRVSISLKWYGNKIATGALPTELTSPVLAVSLFCQYLCSGRSEVIQPYMPTLINLKVSSFIFLFTKENSIVLINKDSYRICIFNIHNNSIVSLIELQCIMYELMHNS